VTTITANVPDGAGTGKISVTTSGGTATSATDFTVAPGVTVNLASVGPPTSTRTATFSGFGAFEAVDVYFDTTDIALGSADGNGAGSATLTIPASASPGTHWVTAVGRHSGYSAQTAFTVRTDWPTTGFGVGHHGFNPYENTLSTSSASRLDEEWTFATGGSIQSQAVAVGGVLYFGSNDDNVYAVTQATGAIKWQFTTGGSVYSAPAVVGGVVYAGSSDGKVYALKASTGALMWSHATAGSILWSSPAVANGMVYIGSTASVVYALKTSTGAQVWAHTTAGAIYSSPAVSGGVVYVGSYDDDTLYALDAATGATRWTYVTGSAVFSSPSVHSGAVYFGSDDGKFYAINARTGALLWSFTGSSLFEGSPAIVAGVVYIGDDAGVFRALDARSGGLQWSTSTDGAIYGAPAVANGVVYVPAGNSIYAFATYGSLLWKAKVGATADGVIVADGMVTASVRDGNLYQYALDGGSSAGAVARPLPASLRPNLSLREQRNW
jgi:outer membrane protein assembly factor BamB